MGLEESFNPILGPVWRMVEESNKDNFLEGSV